MQRNTIAGDGAERLARIALFAELSPGQRRMIARVLDEVSAEPGETIMLQGEPGYEVLVLEEGTAEVLKDGARINEMGPGELFGELAVLEDGASRSATVVATSALRGILLTAHFMREVRERLPAVGEKIDDMAVERRRRDERAAT